MSTPRPAGPYSPIIRAGDWLIVSGQIGIDGATLVEGGLAAQATQALANLRTLLESEGAGLDRVAKTTVFLADMADFAAVNEIYAAAFGDHRPARSAVAVKGLPLGAVVEVEAWAYVGP